MKTENKDTNAEIIEKIVPMFPEISKDIIEEIIRTYIKARASVNAKAGYALRWPKNSQL